MNAPQTDPRTDLLLSQLPAVPREWQLGLGQAVVAVAVAFGANLSGPEQTRLVALSALALTLLVAGGTFLRRGRAKHLGALLHADPHEILLELGVLVDELHVALDAARAVKPAPVSRQLEAVRESGAQLDAAERANAAEPTPEQTPEP